MNYWDLHERAKKVSLDLFLLETLVSAEETKEMILKQLARSRAMAESGQKYLLQLYEDNREF